jgi:hypothetical protein
MATMFALETKIPGLRGGISPGQPDIEGQRSGISNSLSHHMSSRDTAVYTYISLLSWESGVDLIVSCALSTNAQQPEAS